MMELYQYDAETLRQMLADADAVDAAVCESVREALLMHKRLGNPVVSWENGRVVWIPADQIPDDFDGTTE
jgi:hypothetical protein